MQVQVGLLARALAAQGVEVTVACGPGPIDAGDVRVVRLPALTPTGAPSVVRALRRAAGDAGAQVVHGHGLRLAPLLAATARRRAVVTCHGIDPARARRTALVARASGVAVAACGEGPRRVLGTVGCRSRVLDNAVPTLPAPLPREELAARFGLEPSDLLVVSPARLSEQKDPVTLVRALAHARAVSAVLVGGGPLESAVRAEVARGGLAGRVAIAPWSDDARAMLAGADVVALASRWEGQPTVVLEAMAAGVAVVATSCTGTRDTVVDGETALLAPPGDAIGLGEALVRAKDPVLRARLTATATSAVATHAPAVVAAAHLDAYARLADGAWLDPRPT
jgi:glycosyltransferase involved in cell wall biosynthesis